MAQGIAQGESTTAIAKRFEKIGVSEGAAAKRLARTMIGGAQNGGKQAAMQRASTSGIIMGKQWKAFHDARTRDSHIMLDNEIVAVDDAFSNGCRYPRDPEGAPGEICNCRCGMSGKVMGFRHADGSVTMVDMSVNCTEMPEGVFPPGYTYSRWKQDAQNRITAKQLREEELAAAENPGYGNSLLQKGRKSGIITTKISNGVVVNQMDADKYYKMKKGLARNGIQVISAKGDDLLYLNSMNAEAMYSSGYIMHIGEIPAASTMFEEIIHSTQAKKYGELGSTDYTELYAREVAANRMLLKNAKQYGFDKTDVNDISSNLYVWETNFERRVGVPYDEASEYHREI